MTDPAAHDSPSERDVPALVAEVLRVREERDALRARVAELERLVKGDTTPPTDAEIDAHDGPWWIVLDHAAGFAVRSAEGDEAKKWAQRQRERGAVFIWRAFHASTGELVPRGATAAAPSETVAMTPDVVATWGRVLG